MFLSRYKLSEHFVQCLNEHIHTSTTRGLATVDGFNRASVRVNMLRKLTCFNYESWINIACIYVHCMLLATPKRILHESLVLNIKKSDHPGEDIYPDYSLLELQLPPIIIETHSEILHCLCFPISLQTYTINCTMIFFSAIYK